MAQFEKQAQSELEALQDEVDKIEQEMVPLHRRLMKLNVKIDALRQYLDAEFDPQTEKPPARHEGEKLNSLDHIERVLRRAGEPLNYLDILNRLKTEENFDIGGKDPKANLTAKLSGSRKFKRVERGVYILSEWEKLTGKESSPLLVKSIDR